MKSYLTKTIAFVLVSLLLSVGIKAQNNKPVHQKAYITNSQLLWKKAINESDNDLDRAIAHYGILVSTMADKDEEAFDQYIDTTIDLLEKLEERKATKAEALALKAAVYGLIMAYSPWKGMYYGFKTSNAIEKAMELGPDNPVVLCMKANNLYYTPENYGGDKQAAVQRFQQSIEQFESTNTENENWLYLYALVHLGQSYKAVGNIEAAISTYERILEITPDFQYVSQVLLPKTAKK